MKQLILSLITCFIVSYHSNSQEVISLWNDKDIPNYKHSDEQEFIPKRDIIFIQKVQKPTLEIFLPSKQNANGMAVLILPGGGYSGVAYDWEGTDYAKWLNSKGIAAFVLKYRMPQATSVVISQYAPIQDAQRAIRYIRYHSEKFNIQKNKVGVIGSSAGGHLASTLGTHFENDYYISKDEIDNASTRPDFMMLIYPVISMKNTITHLGSRNRLLGKNPSHELVLQFSNELQITTKTPPTFIVHSGNDRTVPVENSLLIYNALLKNNVATTLHIFPNGGHGYSMGKSRNNAPDWTNLAGNWLDKLFKY